MHENPDMEKPFSETLAGSTYRAAKSLCRFGGLPVKLAKTRGARGGTNSSGSGKPAAANRM
ncbi:MAG: hypothetical protein ACYC6G_13870 [Desulfobaccales bacterium]